MYSNREYAYEQGRSDSLKGKSLRDNGYDPDMQPTLYAEWRKGWVGGCMDKGQAHEEQYFEGFSARQNGDYMAHNPYINYDREGGSIRKYFNWNRGWQVADKHFSDAG